MSPVMHVRASVSEITDHAPGLRSLVLTPERQLPRFKPGQFLHLALDDYQPSSHWPESRVFSIASPPEQRQSLRITVSEVGRFTKRIMGLKPQEQVWLKLPYGDFTFQAAPGRPFVMVAGGTGITPFLSLLTSHAPCDHPIHVLYGARTPQLLIYREGLEQACSTCANRSLTCYAEDEASGDVQPGRPTIDSILEAAQKLGRPSETDFYLSGPPQMLRDLRQGLQQAGIAPEHIHVDAWE